MELLLWIALLVLFALLCGIRAARNARGLQRWPDRRRTRDAWHPRKALDVRGERWPNPWTGGAS